MIAIKYYIEKLKRKFKKKKRKGFIY